MIFNDTILQILPYHLKDDISYYLWRWRMNSVISHYNNVFADLMMDGRVWIKFNFLAEKESRYQRIGGMSAFNFRILEDHTTFSSKSISQILENKDGLFELINNDLFIIKDNTIIKELIFLPLPPNYY